MTLKLYIKLSQNQVLIPDRLLEQMQDPEIKAELISNTEEAVKRGTFGKPTFFVGEEMYFGKDTLWQVEESLSECPKSMRIFL
ncbi:MAG: hypothetical protein Ct9H90mP4_06290 [Gammaproteobacteria bacterium]|nr:MAG: hypothetical protein Ct9H90mP4_06290 [Gammaproteobacteria bacterium]